MEDDKLTGLECAVCMRLLYEPVSTTCGHSFCKSCLVRAVDYKQECPTCRAPCSALLSVNVVLANLVKDRFPEEYELRKNEERAIQSNTGESSSQPQDELFTLPVIVESSTSIQRLLPGIPTTLKVNFDASNALLFANRSGSNKVAILANDQVRDGYLVEILSMTQETQPNITLSLRCTSRLILISPVEFNSDQGYFVGRFRTQKDDPGDTERLCDLLYQIRAELDSQFSMIGQLGKARLVSYLESIPAFQSTERQFFISPDLAHVRPLLSNRYSYFERLSFLLMSVVFISANAEIIESLVFYRNTDRRLEAVRAALLSGKHHPVLLLEQWEQSNLCLRTVSSSESLLRANSPFSAIIVLLLVVVILFLRGVSSCMSSPDPSTPTETPQPTFLSKVKGGLSSVGHSIDASISTVMKDLGQNIRVDCPGCHGLILAPPNEFVECPKCQHQFQSPTAATRTSQIASELSQGSKETGHPAPSPTPQKGA